MKLLAVDPSITCTGWALFNLNTEKLTGVGNIKPLSAEHSLANRLLDLNQQVNDLLQKLSLGQNDIMFCESPTSMIDPSAAIKVEQVRCCFETLAREQKIKVPGRINSRSVHYEILGIKGKQLAREHVKDLAINAVEKLYQNNLKELGFDCSYQHMKSNQDIIDAILIGHLALQRVQSAQAANLEISDYLEGLQQKRVRRRMQA